MRQGVLGVLVRNRIGTVEDKLWFVLEECEVAQWTGLAKTLLFLVNAEVMRRCLEMRSSTNWFGSWSKGSLQCIRWFGVFLSTSIYS